MSLFRRTRNCNSLRLFTNSTSYTRKIWSKFYRIRRPKVPLLIVTKFRNKVRGKPVLKATLKIVFFSSPWSHTAPSEIALTVFSIELVQKYVKIHINKVFKDKNDRNKILSQNRKHDFHSWVILKRCWRNQESILPPDLKHQ